MSISSKTFLLSVRISHLMTLNPCSCIFMIARIFHSKKTSFLICLSKMGLGNEEINHLPFQTVFPTLRNLCVNILKKKTAITSKIRLTLHLCRCTRLPEKESKAGNKLD
eukprot:NODE_447_length_8464_cov_0.381112.p9 type:complete len:109 gc:universal NODE_447_length_8464_cov_0.381112:1945-2271(+)